MTRPALGAPARARLTLWGGAARLTLWMAQRDRRDAAARECATGAKSASAGAIGTSVPTLAYCIGSNQVVPGYW